MHNFFRTLAPEKFHAKVTIRADGSYTYSYDGILIFVPGLIEACRAGGSNERLDAQLSEAAAQLRQEGFRRAEYLGRGRYSVTMELIKTGTQPSYFPSREMAVFSVRPQVDGAIVIRGSRPDPSSACQLVGTDAEIDGELIVTLERGVKMLNHNAQNKLRAKDLSTVYTWRIKSPDADPLIVVRAVSRSDRAGD